MTLDISSADNVPWGIKKQFNLTGLHICIPIIGKQTIPAIKMDILSSYTVCNAGVIRIPGKI